MSHVLVNTGPTTRTLTWYVNGVATDVGTVTVTVTDSAGNAIATDAATTNNADGTYDYDLAIQTQVKDLTFVWADDDTTQTITEHVEVVGAHLFTIAELRTFHGSDLASTSTYPTDDLAQVRADVTDEFETICGVSFIPRYHRQSVAGNLGTSVWVSKNNPTTMLDATDGSATLTPADFTADPVLPVFHYTNGVLSAATKSDPFNITVGYRHGYEQVPPEIKQAALIVAHQRLVANTQGTGVPYRATTWTDSTGTFQAYAANDKTGRWYGMPEVDNALRRHNLNVPIL